MITTKLKKKEMVLTSHNLESLKLKKKLEAVPVEKLTDVQRRFLANEANGEMITIHDVREAKDKQIEDAKEAERQTEINAAAEKLLNERQAKVDIDKAEKPVKVKRGKVKKV
jgi:hypothetical protein